MTASIVAAVRQKQQQQSDSADRDDERQQQQQYDNPDNQKDTQQDKQATTIKSKINQFNTQDDQPDTDGVKLDQDQSSAADQHSKPTIEKSFYKRRRVEATIDPRGHVIPRKSSLDNDANDTDEIKQVLIQFRTTQGDSTGDQLSVPIDISNKQLTDLLNTLLRQDDEPMPYSFYINETEQIINTLKQSIKQLSKTSSDDDDESNQISTESLISITYTPQAIFRVQSVSRCCASLPGHTQSILHCCFSPNGRLLATGSGDSCVRIWDINTCTPIHIMSGHSGWVLSLAFSPNNLTLISACMSGEIRCWSTTSGKLIGKPLRAHSKWITSLCWEPFHLNSDCSRIASASKDGDIKIWDLKLRHCTHTLAGHTQSIKCIRWSGLGVIYSASQDRTIKVWSMNKPNEGKLIRTLQGHGHWVNSISINTEYALRQNCYDHKGNCAETLDECILVAKKKYEAALAKCGGRELLVSGSDDFTAFLWDPMTDKKPIHRLTGHQQPINQVMFSPDGSWIATASFDKSIRIWHGTSGKFKCVFRGHVQAVYMIAWSADSRLLASASKDSTIKCWSIQKQKMTTELPGHADEVYALDWSPDGDRVASGGKDQLVKIWAK